jgi:hypothetical protein
VREKHNHEAPGIEERSVVKDDPITYVIRSWDCSSGFVRLTAERVLVLWSPNLAYDM